MITRNVLSLTAAASFALAAALQAQQTQPPPVRQISTVTAVSHDSLSAVSTAVEVAGGKIYVNDILGHRVMLYDSTLAHMTVVADSDPSSPNAYGARPGTLMPFHGDSALFITPASLSMLVLSPAGQIQRVMAMPPTGGSGPAGLIGNIFGTPGFDAQGRLLFFAPVRMQFVGRADGPPPVIEPPDSAMVVRFNFASRTLDTAAVIHIPKTRSTMSRDDRGQMHMTMTAFPPATVDDWAVTSDGRLAVVRGRDYHVEWLGTDGAWTSCQRMPFGWEHLDDEHKQTLIDSTAAAMQTIMDSMPARMARAEGGGGGGGNGARVDAGRGAAPGGGMVMVFAGPGDGPREGGPGGGGPPRSISFAAPTVVKAAPADVPDYRPAFGQGAVRADRDGNLWIRTTKMIDGRPVYDIVNGQGQLVDRVQLPQFRTIAGFGNGVVFLGVRDANGVMHLERARIR